MSEQASVTGKGLFRRSIDKVSTVLAFIAVVCIAFVLVAVIADVTSRTFFGQSIGGVVEMAEVMMVIIVFLGLGYAERRGAHVSMTLLVRKLPSRAAAIVNAIAFVVVVAVLGWMMWVTGDRAIASVVAGEYRFGLVRVAVWPARIAIAVGLAVYLLEVFLGMFDNFRTVYGKRSKPIPAVDSVSPPLS
jgi:TRAP-type C4-dicarboxylate transport system permease small subunit